MQAAELFELPLFSLLGENDTVPLAFPALNKQTNKPFKRFLKISDYLNREVVNL